MTPAVIIATIQAGFEFGTELLKFLQTDEGKKIMTTAFDDKQKWDDFWKHTGDGVKHLFSGQLFEK